MSNNLEDILAYLDNGSITSALNGDEPEETEGNSSDYDAGSEWWIRTKTESLKRLQMR